jgi:hypothetical protein
MCTPAATRLLSLIFGALLTACSGDLTLPDNGTPPVDGLPATLRVVSGNGQEGTVGRLLDDPLVVQVVDGGSQPVAGVPVVFRFQSDVPEAEVDPTEAETNDDGLATAEVRLGTEEGTQSVEARVAEPELSATFDLTAVEHDTGKKGKGGHGHDDDDDD